LDMCSVAPELRTPLIVIVDALCDKLATVVREI